MALDRKTYARSMYEKWAVELYIELTFQSIPNSNSYDDYYFYVANRRLLTKMSLSTLDRDRDIVILDFLLLVNDPSAGSPTETLLRLLLPLDNAV
jgi:hypothetical protein